MRVLNWIIDRCEGKVDAKETPIGYVPFADDIDISDMGDFKKETLETILEVDKEVWKQEVSGIEEFYAKLGDRLPNELREQLNNLKTALN